VSSKRHTPETLLISAVLNSGDAFTAKTYGVLPTHFRGYRDEYEWILAYYEQYGDCPSPLAFKTKFKDFPHTDKQADARYPAHELKREWASRDLLTRANKAIEELAKDNVEGAYEQIEGARLEIVTARPADVLSDPAFLDDYYDEEEQRIQVPWRTLQQMTNGIGPGELWYLAARQGNGKSSYLVDMAVEAAFRGHRVCFYSMEMTKRQVQIRAQAAMAYRLGVKVDAHKMLHRTWDSTQYKELLGRISEHMQDCGGAFDIHVPKMGAVSPGVIASLASEYELHTVDYAGLMRTDAGQAVVSDWRYMAEVSNSMSQLALAKETSILAASQVNRDGDTISPKPPKLKNLAQSDHLGNDGHVVITMKRYGMGAGIFSVEKNRHGPSLSLFYTKYEPNTGDFSEINSHQANEIKDESDARDYM
jgi:replicative DNA helicase